MSNALGIDLHGVTVVLKAETHVPEFRAPRDLLFKVHGGFGARPDTMGRALMGTYLADGEEARVDGHAVERVATTEDLSVL